MLIAMELIGSCDFFKKNYDTKIAKPSHHKFVDMETDSMCLNNL
jgi:hypothetical protein